MRDFRAPSRARRALRGVLLATLVVALAACEREERTFRSVPPAEVAGTSVSLSKLQPGPPSPRYELEPPAEESAFAVNQGERFFNWYNCSGCHFHGGGGIGPALMDDQWIYGSEPQNIYATIVEGRPNGMPSFRGRIPEQQVWQIVAYVRSLSGLLPKDVRPTRSDELQVTTQPSSVSRERPKASSTPPSAEKP
ncbi:MAG TPA: cytochrome c [Gemmatimonadaceae bacterium]|nr:cytochrome c [Gemmatimonadaceae bacterium]